MSSPPSSSGKPFDARTAGDPANPARPPRRPAALERNLGEQPLAGLLAAERLSARALVEASPEFITFKMVSRAVRGRRLTPGVQRKILAALMAATGKSYAIRDLFTYAGGEEEARPAGRVRIVRTTFAEAERSLRDVRDEVFGREQSVPRELDWDGNDARCAHVLALDGDRPVGAGRLQPDGRIGRLAVRKPWRQRGIGSRLLEALVDEARARGLGEVYLHAQVPVAEFYARRGFERDGPEFPEAGLRHVVMRRSCARRAARARPRFPARDS